MQMEPWDEAFTGIPFGRIRRELNEKPTQVQEDKAPKADLEGYGTQL